MKIFFRVRVRFWVLQRSWFLKGVASEGRSSAILERRPRMKVLVNTAIGTIALALCWHVAAAEPPTTASLNEQIRQHYKPFKIAAGSAPRPNAGSSVLVGQPGILSVPEVDASFLDVCPSVFRAGEVHPTPGSFCEDLARRSPKTLAVSDRVYVTTILVNGVADRVSFYLATCESCAAGKTPSVNRSLLIFEFPKGYLAKASGEEVIRAAEQVLAVETSGDSDQKTARKDSSTEAAAPAVKTGQTPEQVTAVLGKPEAIIDLGTKLIYSYRSVRIVFVAGKLADVQ